MALAIFPRQSFPLYRPRSEALPNALPVGAVPVKLAAEGALEIFVEPAVGARGDAVADLFLGDFDQFAAATHAARVAAGVEFRKIQFGAREAQLFVDREGWWNPNGVDMAVVYETTVEKKAVGGNDRCAETLGFSDEIGIGDVLGPERFASGGAQPAGEAAEAGIANDAALFGRFGRNFVAANGSGVKATDFFEEGDEEFCMCVAEGRSAEIERGFGAGLEPGQGFGSVAGAEFGEELVVSTFECALDAAHGGVGYQWAQKNASPANRWHGPALLLSS